MRAFLGIGLAVMMSVGANVAAQDDAETRRIKVDGEAHSWIVQETTGRIFVSVPANREVREYDTSGNQVRHWIVSNAPHELLVKGDRLVVACQEPARLVVINLKNNEIAGEVKLAGRGPHALFCSKVDNAFVYCICTSGSWHDSQVHQIDLGAMSVRNRTKTMRWGQSHVAHVAMSADGKWIVPDARGFSSPSGADLMEVNEETCTFTQIFDYHKSFGQMVAGPFNRYWTFGNVLYNLDIRAPVRKFTGSPVAIHPQFDLVVSFRDGSLWLESLSAAEAIAEVEIGTKVENRRRPGQLAADPVLQFDVAGNHVVWCVNDTAVIVPLAKYTASLKPLLMIASPSRFDVLYDTPWQSELQLSNPDLTPNTKFSLVEGGDQGVQLDGRTLKWIPGANHIGLQQIRVKATHEQMSDELTIAMSVRPHSVEYDFTARAIATNFNGKRAILWGPRSLERSGGYVGPGSGLPERLSLFDIEQMKVVATKNFDTGIRAAAVDDNYVYIAPTSGNVLYRLDQKDFNVSKRVFLNGTPIRIITMPKGKIVVQFGNQCSWAFYDAATLQPIESVDRPITSSSLTAFSRLQAEQFLTPRRIIDAEGNTVCLLANSQLFPTMKYGVRSTQRSHPGSLPQANVWGRNLVNNSIRNLMGQPIVSWSGLSSRLSLDTPIAVSLRQESQNRTLKYFLEYRNLVEGKIIHSSLFDRMDAARPPMGHGSTFPFEVAGGRVLVGMGNRLRSVRVPEDDFENLESPLYLVWPKLPVYEIGEEPLRCQIKARGGSGNIQFSLAATYPGIELDEASGELTVEGAALWKNMLPTLASRSSSTSVRQQLMKQMKDNAIHYKNAFGKDLPADKLAVSIPVFVVASDEEGQIDQISFDMVALGNRKELNEMVVAQQQQIDEQNERRRQEQQRMRELAEQQRQRLRAPGEERLDELEQRIRRMEATLDAILLKLEKLEKDK